MRRFLSSLRSWQLVLLAALLLLADLLIPDPLPFVDELLLAVLTYLLARWLEPRSATNRGRFGDAPRRQI